MPSKGVWRAWSRIVRRGPVFQATQAPFSPSAVSNMAPFAAVSVQDTLLRRHSWFWGAVSLRATWASFSSRPRALQPKRRKQHGALRRSARARHAVTLEDTTPRRQSLFEGAVSLRATWVSSPSRPSALQPKRRQRRGAPCRSKRARRAAVPSTGAWRAWSRIVQRGPAF